jgi:hypothetical protein
MRQCDNQPGQTRGEWEVDTQGVGGQEAEMEEEEVVVVVVVVWRRRMWQKRKEVIMLPH